LAVIPAFQQIEKVGYQVGREAAEGISNETPSGISQATLLS